ncbi:nuclear transport factor 2 family protein [Tissierella creatinini]|nr:nuclear transport factor 2 family protein [Tissierella creatinini]TJX61388.1 nuclear transport factor 2 family protein [Soehngenia saccharolytica]
MDYRAFYRLKQKEPSPMLFSDRICSMYIPLGSGLTRRLNMKSKRKSYLAIIVIIGMALVLFSSCNNSERRKEIIENASSVAERYFKSWTEKDPDALSSLLSDELIGFDAQMPGWSYNKKSSEDMLRDPNFWTQFVVHQGTFFVSYDGNFVATSTVMDFFGQTAEQVPNAHIIAIKDEQVYFAYDYYGASMSENEPLLIFEPSTVDIGSPEAEALVKQSKALLKKWQSAYNNRDTEEYLSCFAEDVLFIYLSSPEWHVMTKDELAKDISVRFSRKEFTSTLESTKLSPITEGFFVSADGHYAAAQGTYQDLNVSSIPMAIYLKIEDGLIVSQYNYMDIDLDQLQ